ncbi:MAG: GNAT family N-acetyltransferase [Candidatus Lokiarchaeota archaeon]|nr:GNAT family N-acetyltransferase [Candidatus Harpocratesius repetitus]
MQIRNFSMEYYHQVYQLWELGNLSLGISDTPEQIQRFATKNPDLFLIGLINNRVIGVVMGAFDGRRGYVHHLAVHPDFQKQGIGTTLMKELMTQFQAQHVEKVHLFVERSNADVIAFYEKLGWFIRHDLEMMSIIVVTS